MAHVISTDLDLIWCLFRSSVDLGLGYYARQAGVRATTQRGGDAGLSPTASCRAPKDHKDMVYGIGIWYRIYRVKYMV